MPSAPPLRPIKLYRHPVSGHCHRVELLLSLLKLPHERIDVDLRSKAHKAPNFLELNPFGQIPVVQDAGATIADSNAILVYLAGRYDASGQWLPREPLQAAAVQRWLSVAAGEIAYGPAAARRMKLFGHTEGLPEAQARAHALLALLEDTLKHRQFLIGAQPTIADLACYSYIARAPEGDVSLDAYVAVRAWLGRIEALPGFVPFMHSQPLQV